jgi:hypothetical protein
MLLRLPVELLDLVLLQLSSGNSTSARQRRVFLYAGLLVCKKLSGRVLPALWQDLYIDTPVVESLNKLRESRDGLGVVERKSRSLRVDAKEDEGSLESVLETLALLPELEGLVLALSPPQQHLDISVLFALRPRRSLSSFSSQSPS